MSALFSEELPFAGYLQFLLVHTSTARSPSTEVQRRQTNSHLKLLLGELRKARQICMYVGGRYLILIYKYIYISKGVEYYAPNKSKDQAIRPCLSKLLPHLFNGMLGSYKNYDAYLYLLKCVCNNFIWKNPRFQSNVYNRIPLLFFKIHTYRHISITQRQTYTQKRLESFILTLNYLLYFLKSWQFF